MILFLIQQGQIFHKVRLWKIYYLWQCYNHQQKQNMQYQPHDQPFVYQKHLSLQQFQKMKMY